MLTQHTDSHIHTLSILFDVAIFALALITSLGILTLLTLTCAGAILLALINVHTVLPILRQPVAFLAPAHVSVALLMALLRTVGARTFDAGDAVGMESL